MKLFQQCLRNTCDQMRYRYEHQLINFSRIYLQYEKCVVDKFKILGLYTSDPSSNTQNDDIVLGGGKANDQKFVQNSQMQLTNNYNKIVNIYEDCLKLTGRGLEELDNYKSCQIDCLDQSIKMKSSGSSSTLSTNLIIVIVFSIVGFALILFLLYKCEKKISKKRTHRISFDIELHQKNEENELGYEPSEKENAKKYLTQQKYSSNKNQQGSKVKAGLSRLNVNKMIEIVNNLKQANPEMSDMVEFDEVEEYSFQKKQEIKKQLSSEQNDRTLQNFNLSNNNSHYLPSKDQSKVGTFRQMDISNQMIQQNLEALNNQAEAGHLQNTSNTYNSFKSNGVFSNDQFNTMQQLPFSPKEPSNTNKKSQNEQEYQLSLTEQPNQKEYKKNDKNSQYSSYEYNTYTSPCDTKEQQSKYNTKNQQKSGQLNIFQDLPIQINGQLSKENNQNKIIDIQNSPQSPHYKMSCETQENSNESPDQLKGKQGIYQQQFQLYPKNQQDYDSIDQNIQILECNE